MIKTVNRILLIDDNEDDNLYHEIIKKTGIADSFYIAKSTFDALDYLTSAIVISQLIFLDINMPKMNGFEFLEAYKKIRPAKIEKEIIVMLTTSMNPADKEKAEQNPLINDFKIKPLTKEMLLEIMKKFF